MKIEELRGLPKGAVCLNLKGNVVFLKERAGTSKFKISYRDGFKRRSIFSKDHNGKESLDIQLYFKSSDVMICNNETDKKQIRSIFEEGLKEKLEEDGSVRRVDYYGESLLARTRTIRDAQPVGHTQHIDAHVEALDIAHF